VAECPGFILETITAPLEASTQADAGVVRMPTPGIFGIPQELVNDGREQYMRDTILAVALELRGSLRRLPTEDEVFDVAWPQYSAKVDLSRPGRGPEEMRAKIRYTLERMRVGLIKGIEVEPEHRPEETPKEMRTDGRTPSPLPLVYFDDVEPNLTASDFVEGLLGAGAFSVVYGPSNCGKTFFATDLGLHVAAGMEWRGRAVDQGGVIYCALEGGSGISNRVAAWRREQGLDGEQIPFAVVPVSINLLDPDADRQKLVTTIEIAASELKTPVVLIVIDTLSRAMAGGNENAPNDMGALVNSADFIRQATKGHLMFIHHSGKDDSKGARGHSSLRAATDTEIEVGRSDSQAASFARVTKQREMEIEGEFRFKLRTVKLGINRRGKAVTSCVVEPVDGSAPKAGANRELTGNNKLALVALRHAIDAAGIRRTGDPDIPPSVLSVTTKAWRHQLYARMPEHKPDAKQKAFSRATIELQEEKRVAVMNGFAWILEAESG
jgi:AAA domain